jgi:light-regulated signal transduction histidine kinase (bacteriophytochrome)
MEANEKLAAQYAAIEKHAVELRNKNKELDAFTYISSHDLQEPLRKIQTFVNLLLSNEYPNLSDSGKVKFERILYSTNRMRELITSLLTFSRTNIVDRKFENVDLNAIVNDVQEALSENIQEKKAAIVTDLHGSVKIIPFQFIQLIENLVHNSLKFSRNEVPLQIEIKSRVASGTELEHEKLVPEQDYCHISFHDNGIGFDPQHNEKIFGVFQKLHNSNTYSGTGIGLAIVKKIVDNHNGIISASGKPMKGAEFNIYIPN